MRIAIAAALVALAPGVLAQSLDDGDAVVVTATRFPDSKRDLPVGITVITAEDIRQSATSTLPEILAQHGLLHVRDNSGTPNRQVDLRGFGITGDQNTLVLVDGVRLSENEIVPAQLNSIALESIERIEILRGSGAVQYGGGATAGVVNIITRRGEPGRTRAYAVGRAGGYGTVEGRAGYSHMGQTVGISLDASQENTDGYRRSNDYKQTNVAAKLEARTDTTRGYLRLAAGDQKLGLPGALTEAQIAADPRQASTPGDTSKRKDSSATLGGAWTPGRHEFAADLSVRDKKSDASFLGFGGTDVETRADVTAFTPRAKFRFDAFGRQHDLSLGLDWESLDYKSNTDFGGFPGSRRVGDQENEAFHAQANLWLAARTRLAIGGRVQETRERLTEQLIPDDRRAKHSLDAYEVALRQGFAQGWSAYVKSGTSFRVATFDENACFFPPCAIALLEPQTARTDELGVEYERSGLRGRLAVYAMDLENEIYFSAATFSNVNLPPTRRKGMEMEGAWRVAQGLELRGSLALMQARFRATGNDVPLVPDTIATAGVHWNFLPSSAMNLNLRHVGEQRYDGDETSTFARLMPDYTLVDLRLEHNIGRLQLALEVRNLFDEGYYSYGIRNGAGTTFAAYPEPGRAAYALIAYRLE
jgi:iron complex outermembrane receptor protein